jgi:hypothetical protein
MAVTYQQDTATYRRPGEVNNTVARVFPIQIAHLSWGAVLAGVVIALVVMLLLNLLGLAIGAATVNPLREIDPVEPGLGTAAVVWFAVTNLLALFAGGAMAGRVSGLYANADGVLHGLVTWAVTSLLVIVLLTSSVGSLVSGVAGAAVGALGAVGNVATELAPDVADALNVQTMTLDGVRTEIADLTSAARAATTPDAEATNGSAQAEDGGRMTLDDLEITRGFSALFAAEPDPAARDSLVTLLTERTNLTPEEADATVTRWQNAYQTARDDAEAAARAAADAAANAVTVLTGISFMALVLGAFAAGAGGIVGAPEPGANIRDEPREVIVEG